MRKKRVVALSLLLVLVLSLLALNNCAGSDALRIAKKSAIIDYAFMTRAQQVVAAAHANWLAHEVDPTVPLQEPYLTDKQYEMVAPILDAIADTHNAYLESLKIAEKLPEDAGRDEIIAALESSLTEINTMYSKATKILEAFGIDLDIKL